MKVFVARHAETNYNVLGLCNDSPKVEVHLTPWGVTQAEELAATLEAVNFDVIIISEFPRTRETAAVVNKHHNVPVIIDPRINDVLTGYEGKPVQEYREALRNADNRWTARFNGGESFEDYKKRAQAFLCDLRKRNAKTVLIVTHQALARVIYGIAHHLSNEETVQVKVSNTHCFDFKL